MTIMEQIELAARKDLWATAAQSVQYVGHGKCLAKQLHEKYGDGSVSLQEVEASVVRQCENMAFPMWQEYNRCRREQQMATLRSKIEVLRAELEGMEAIQ